MNSPQTHFLHSGCGLLVILLAVSIQFTANGQALVHPGSLHTLADLNRMKTNVLAGNHPWVYDWNVLIT